MGVKRRILFIGGHRGLSSIGVMIRPDLSLPAVEKNDYAEWLHRYDTLTVADKEKIISKIANFQIKPLISVVMPVYNPPAKFLDEAIQSVRNQLYTNWELCIADDASTDVNVRKVLDRHYQEDDRIKVVYRKTNGHISIASNSAIKLVTGDWIALLDHDDLLTEHALFWVADAINQHLLWD
jgi:cellulose synthase/poly-beta-1,6-N-acetylglucosamine synthase-like glycosyltransferase